MKILKFLKAHLWDKRWLGNHLEMTPVQQEIDSFLEMGNVEFVLKACASGYILLPSQQQKIDQLFKHYSCQADYESMEKMLAQDYCLNEDNFEALYGCAKFWEHFFFPVAFAKKNMVVQHSFPLLTKAVVDYLQNKQDLFVFWQAKVDKFFQDAKDSDGRTYDEIKIKCRDTKDNNKLRKRLACNRFVYKAYNPYLHRNSDSAYFTFEHFAFVLLFFTMDFPKTAPCSIQAYFHTIKQLESVADGWVISHIIDKMKIRADKLFACHMAQTMANVQTHYSKLHDEKENAMDFLVAHDAQQESLTPDLPQEVSEQLRQLKQLHQKIEPYRQEWTGQQQFDVDNIFQKTLPYMLQQYSAMDEEHRHQLPNHEGYTAIQVLMQALQTIGQSLSAIHQQINENRLHSLTISGRYLSKLKNNG